MDLHGASFDSANLIHVNFAGADLSGAKFTDYGHREHFTTSIVESGYAYAPAFPDFTCADLSGADFTGSTFFGIWGIRSTNLHTPSSTEQILRTRMGKNAVLLTASQVPPNYNPLYLPRSTSSFLFEGFQQVGKGCHL